MASKKKAAKGPSEAWLKVFGGVNGNTFNRSESKQEMRIGKTARAKAKGHIPYQKNRRVWEDGGRKGEGRWIKA